MSEGHGDIEKPYHPDLGFPPRAVESTTIILSSARQSIYTARYGVVSTEANGLIAIISRARDNDDGSGQAAPVLHSPCDQELLECSRRKKELHPVVAGISNHDDPLADL